MVTRETFPKHRVNQDPSLHTWEVSFPPPGRCSLVAAGLGLKPDLPGQILPCQFYISVTLGKLVINAPQRLNPKIRGKMMCILLGCNEE